MAVDPLPPGSSQLVSISFVVPAVRSGSFSIIAVADEAALVAEREERNNRRTARLRVTHADLTVARLTLSPTHVMAGDTVAATAVVANASQVPAEASTLHLYLETASDAPSGPATLLWADSIGILSPGESRELSVRFTVPVVPYKRSYRVWAQVDPDGSLLETNENNNRREVRLRMAMPDLAVTALGVAPVLVHPGQAATASVRIANRGRARSRPTTADVFLATSDSAALHEATQAWTLAVDALNPGDSISLPVPLTVPFVDPGAHYVIAQVDASTGGAWTAPAVRAASTGPSPSQPRKTVKLRVGLPDLVVSALSLSPNEGSAGARITVTLTVQNAGRTASTSTSVGFYLASSADASPAGAVALGEIGVPGTGAGTSTRLSTTLTIPAADDDAYHLFALVDPSGAVTESIETNNARSSPLVIDSANPPEEPTRNPYGILVNGVDRMTPRSEIVALMAKVKQSGAAWVRTDFWWYSTEWVGPGIVDWAYFDALVEEAEVRGLTLIPILWGTPGWAATDGVFSYGVPDMAAWERFVFQTVSRYRGRVPVWEIWNEPNLPFYWRGTPHQYAELLARAYTQIKRADPQATVLLGGQAQGGGSRPDFLPEILRDATFPAGQYFDVHNVHTAFSSLATIASYLDWHRSVLADHGLTNAIAVTELSYTSDRAYQIVTGYTDGEDGQARYLADTYRMLLSEPGVLMVVWACLRDYANGLGEYSDSGLVTVDLSDKSALAIYQEMARSSAPATLANWQP